MAVHAYQGYFDFQTSQINTLRKEINCGRNKCGTKESQLNPQKIVICEMKNVSLLVIFELATMKIQITNFLKFLKFKQKK